MSKYNFFVYCPYKGFEAFKTRDEALDAADARIQRYLGDDGWNEDVTRIVAGEITHRATMCDQVFPDGEIDEDGFDEEGNRWETDEDYKCNYKMLPLNTEYEKLQTEYEQLVSYTKNGIECFANPCPEHSGVNTPPFSEFRERYGQLCLMCVVDERDTLRAECEKLRSKTRVSLGVGDGGGSLFVHGDYDSIKRVQALIFECENLRKDAARYQSLLEAVLREIPHRQGNRGNAPGHAHSVPGIWDEDNGALAGKECAWCKVWNEAVSAMPEEPSPS